MNKNPATQGRWKHHSCCFVLSLEETLLFYALIQRSVRNGYILRLDLYRYCLWIRCQRCDIFDRLKLISLINLSG